MSWLQQSKAGKKGNQKITNMWTLNSTLSTNQQVKESLEKLYFEMNENGNTSYQNLGDAVNYYSQESIAKYLC